MPTTPRNRSRLSLVLGGLSLGASLAIGSVLASAGPHPEAVTTGAATEPAPPAEKPQAKPDAKPEGDAKATPKKPRTKKRKQVDFGELDGY